MNKVNSQQEALFPKLGAGKSWFEKALSALGLNLEDGWPDSFGNALIKWNHAHSERKVTVISLFSGAGGLDIGFHDAGFKIIECNEIEPGFSATLDRNSSPGSRLEGTNIVCQDVHDYHPGVEKVDFIIGGPPCQTFSAAGARAAGVNGTDDDRGNLFLQYARIIHRLQPRGFLFENVYRIVGAQSGKPWEKIQESFQELGYKLYWRILDAADYGVPQFRERLFIVGLKSGSYRFPLPSHGPDSVDGRNYYTAAEAISGLNIAGCKTGLSGRHGHLLNEIPPGLNYSYYTERMGHPRPLFGWRSKFSDYLYKADPDVPVRTIKAQGGQYTGPFSWENRPFTVEELKRLQTFPDDYVIAGNRQRIIHQLGNSVPPQLARVLAISILEQVFQANLPFSIATMPDNYKLGFRKRKAQLTHVYAEKAATSISKNGLRDDNSVVSIKDKQFFSLNPDLSLCENSTESSSDYVAEFSLQKTRWVIKLSEICSKSRNIAYGIQIALPRRLNSAKNNRFVPVTLISRSCNPKSILALWKAFELLAQKHLSKDDLVQLFGYYQYKLAYTIRMTFRDDSLLSSSFWRVVKLVTEGQGIGCIIRLSELSALYELSDDELFNCLRAMKELGYEIRSSKTNKQIPEGMVLVPYAFPTLNQRSLQRLTRL